MLRTIIVCILMVTAGNVWAGDEFYLDSTRNKRALRFEFNNDIVFDRDSNFTNGWNVQYHTIRYPTWDDSQAPGFLKWVGNHFPTLGDDDSIVRYGHTIGQNMFTPGDLTNPNPPPGDLPYAGTLTYSLSWQSFNRRTRRNFQITAGVMGEESLAEEFQKFVHNDLGIADDPKGWHTQRKSEPAFNLAYEYYWRLAHIGTYTNDWAGQVEFGPTVQLGNLITSADLEIGIRFGWNIKEGFGALPTPAGGDVHQANGIPKPKTASPHGVEFIAGIRGGAILYSVIYDGSFITDDDREVDREDFVYSWVAGISYHNYDVFSVRIAIVNGYDLIKPESLPDPPPGRDKTAADNSYGTVMVDFYF